MTPASALCCAHTCHEPATWMHKRLGLGLCDWHFGLDDEALEGTWRPVRDVPLPTGASRPVPETTLDEDASQTLQDRR